VRTVALAQLDKRRDPTRGYEPMLERADRAHPHALACATGSPSSAISAPPIRAAPPR